MAAQIIQNAPLYPPMSQLKPYALSAATIWLKGLLEGRIF